MTATTTATTATESGAAPPAASGGAGVPARRRRRWLRLVLPYAVVALLVLVTAVTYAFEEPDLTDPAFLSPTSSDDIGASDLAGRLKARGVTVERHTRTPDALVSADRGDAVLFVPAPDLLHTFYLRMLKLMPASTAIVLVRPTDRTLSRGRLPAQVLDEAWAARVSDPMCALPAATAAGRAAALRSRYEGDALGVTDRCYASGLLRTAYHGTTLTLVGATDPFRNDRIREHGNAALAVGLLSGAKRVVWLDVHRSEPGPKLDERPGLDQSPAPASLGSGPPDPDFPVPDPDGTREGEGQGGQPAELASDEPTMFDLFPAAAWTVLALVLLAALLAALARARRLGGPVAEPLPVLVPATETVTGRGRLYQRSRDRAAALGVLREAARERAARLLDRPSGTAREALVAAVAAHTRRAPEEIDDLLYGPDPENDEALVAAAAALQSLNAAVTRTHGGVPHD